MNALLLPGMDGTGLLFERFCRALPGSIAPMVASYGPLASYQKILDVLETPTDSYFIIAESFSGPLALRLALRTRNPPKAVVLVASFIRSPRRVPAWLGRLLARGLFLIPPPAAALRHWMIGADASAADVAGLRAVLGLVPPAVFGRRLKAVLEVDAVEALRLCPARLLYIGGRQDRLVPKRALEIMQAVRPDLEVALLDAPHLVLQRRPEECASIIQAFLERSGSWWGPHRF